MDTNLIEVDLDGSDVGSSDGDHSEESVLPSTEDWREEGDGRKEGELDARRKRVGGKEGRRTHERLVR